MKDCKAGARPEIEIAEWPSYGRLGDKPVRIIAERQASRAADHPCIGKFIDAIALYYRPVAGFRGSDRVRLRVKFPTTPLRRRDDHGRRDLHRRALTPLFDPRERRSYN